MHPDNGFSLFAPCRCTVAEGPRYHTESDTLYWVDIPQGIIYRQKLRDGGDGFESFDPGIGKIGSLAFDGDELLLFAASCRVWRSRFGGTAEAVAVLPGRENTRFNDSIADRFGHIYCGVAWNRENAVPGELWRYSVADRSFVKLDGDFDGMPNGMGISPDRKTFYFAVSEEYKVYQYDFDEKNGTLANRRLFTGFRPEMGTPDGLAVDPVTGFIKIACWDGYALRTFSPDGRETALEKFPIAKITSIELTEKGEFVTTGNYPWAEEAWTNHKAGAVFRKNERNDMRMLHSDI